MRPTDVLASGTARLAALTAALVVAAVVAVALMAVLAFRAETVDAADRPLRRELGELEDAAAKGGAAALRAEVAARMKRRQKAERLYLLRAPGGPVILGDDALGGIEATSRRRIVSLTLDRGEEAVPTVLRSLDLGRDGSVVVGRPLPALAEAGEAVAQGAWVVALTTVILALAAGALVARTATRRIEAINRTAARIVAGELDQRIPVAASRDELDRLARNLNAMLDRIAELMAAVRGATEAVAHDLRTPLARHRLRLEAALADPPAELGKWLNDGIGEVDRILGTFKGLMQLATIRTGDLRERFAPVDLAGVARDAAQLYEPLIEERGGRLRAELPPIPLRTLGHRDLLFQAVANLLDNAVKHGRAGGVIELTLHAEAGGAVLTVRDDGPGLGPLQRTRAFDRLWRGDSSRTGSEGAGLGLSLVQAIARLHDGTITLEEAESGLAARLILPSLAGGTKRGHGPVLSELGHPGEQNRTLQTCQPRSA